MGVMKKLFLIVCGIIMLFVLSVERKYDILGKESVYDVSMVAGFSFVVEDVNEDFIGISLRNLSAENLCWGTEYDLEKCVGGIWYSVEPQIPEGTVMVWEDIMYVLKSGEDKEISIPLQYYGKLANGTYRVVKQFFFEGQKMSEGSYVAAEFVVE